MNEKKIKIMINGNLLQDLIAAGCSDDAILSTVKTGEYATTDNNIINSLLPKAIKIYKGWGGARPKSGRKKTKMEIKNEIKNKIKMEIKFVNNKNKKNIVESNDCSTELTQIKNQVVNQDGNQVTNQERNQDGNQVDSNLKKNNVDSNGYEIKRSRARSGVIINNINNNLPPSNVSNNKLSLTLSPTKKIAPYFIPPSIEQVAEYIAEKNYGIDAEQFVNFYQSKGWMIGKNRMKDWKAAVRTWVRQRKQNDLPSNHPLYYGDGFLKGPDQW